MNVFMCQTERVNPYNIDSKMHAQKLIQLLIQSLFRLLELLSLKCKAVIYHREHEHLTLSSPVV